MKKNIFHLNSIKKRICLYLVNKVFVGTKKFEKKRKLLNSIGFKIGENTKIVGPIECTGILEIGENCWVGKNLKINGNGKVIIGDNCDIAPEVTFQTGGHKIGSMPRRAGEGEIYTQIIENGVWIGGRSTIIGNIVVGEGSVIGGCSCVVKNVEKNTLVCGVPAKVVRELT